MARGINGVIVGDRPTFLDAHPPVGYTGTAPTFVAGPAGAGKQYAGGGAGSNTNHQNYPSGICDAAENSWLCVLAFTTTGGTNGGALLQRHDTGGGGYNGVHVYIYGGGVGIQVKGASPSNWGSGETAAINDGKPHAILATWTRTGGGVGKMYADNGDIKTTSGVSSWSWTSNAPRFGSDDVYWQNFDGITFLEVFWDRQLSDAEAKIVLANPWALLEPSSLYLPIQTGSGASTTTVTVDAGSLVLTGQPVTNTVTAAVGAGTVTLTGQSVALQQQQPVTAGSTSLTGQSIGITITVPISPGTLSLTGSSVTVVPPSGSSTVTVDPGTLSLTGQAVTNLVTTPVSAGSTSLTGQNIGVTTTVNVSPGSITLTGQVVTVSYLGTQTIPVEPGTISVTGRDVTVSVTGGTKGGAGKGKNLTPKQKKKLKAVVNQEWLKAEQTAKELLQERLGNIEPAKVRVEKLTTVESLADVIAALQALSKETVTLPEQQAVIKSFEKSIDTKVIKTGERLVAIEDKVNETLGRIEKKIQNLEDLLIVVIDELL